jgi:hypothetical protein
MKFLRGNPLCVSFQKNINRQNLNFSIIKKNLSNIFFLQTLLKMKKTKQPMLFYQTSIEKKIKLKKYSMFYYEFYNTNLIRGSIIKHKIRNFKEPLYKGKTWYGNKYRMNIKKYLRLKKQLKRV